MISKKKKRIVISLNKKLIAEIEEIAIDYKTTKSDLIELWTDWYVTNMFERNYKPIRRENND